MGGGRCLGPALGSRARSKKMGLACQKSGVKKGMVHPR